MVINNLMELIKKLFDDNYENIIIADSSDYNDYQANKMTVEQLKSYDINKIDKITAIKGKIYIFF